MKTPGTNIPTLLAGVSEAYQEWQDHLAGKANWPMEPLADEDCAEREMVLPSWNSAPVREVRRAGRTIEVVELDEVDRVTVLLSWHFAFDEDAQHFYPGILAAECANARKQFDRLSPEGQEGAAR